MILNEEIILSFACTHAYQTPIFLVLSLDF